MKVGDKIRYKLQDGTEVEAVVRSCYESDRGPVARLIIPEWNNYKTQETLFENKSDYSIIERTTGMPVNYINLGIKDFYWGAYKSDVSTQKQIVDNYLFKFDEYMKNHLGLYIYSETRGSGKSMLACCIGNELIRKRGLRVKFVSIADYIQLGRKTGNEERDKENFELMRDLRGATVLIVDDIGTQDEKYKWVAESVFSLIKYRTEKRLMTIYTANMGIEKCSTDQRTIDRINDMTLAIKLPEEAIRRQRADARKAEFLKAMLKDA